MALVGEKMGVFKLVVLAWSALASGLGPLMVIRVLGWKITRDIALTTMVAGLAGALAWRYALGYSGDVYDVLPGMASGFIVYFLLVRGNFRPDDRIAGTMAIEYEQKTGQG